MAIYAFTFVNHLGEGFGTTVKTCRDDGHAIECGRGLAARGYPVEVRHGDRVTTTLPAPSAELRDWFSHLRKRWPHD